jgi:allantoate deiminase
MQNRRVHQNDVGHRDERRNPSYHLSPPSRSKLSKLEVLFRFANQDLFTIADVSKQDSQTVIARCRELAAISEMSGGTFRTFLSPAMRRCYEVIGEWMKRAGMTVRLDPAGNLRGLRAGLHPGKGVLLMGSHLDTVRDAGAFDGILGVILAIAIVENLQPEPLPFDLEVIGFCEEEGVRYVPFIGSRALIGTLDEQTLKQTDSAGITMADAITNFGLDPAEIPKAALKTPALGFLEFHIEQGPVLDAAGESVGIVTSIAGQNHALVKFVGSANHAGTTPMHLRRDALSAAAQWIVTVEDSARSTPGLVATIGQISLQPSISNVIPGEVTMSLDVRHAENQVRIAGLNAIHQSAKEISHQRGLELLWTDGLKMNTVQMDDNLTGILSAASPEGTRRMASGAGHDAMILAPHIPSAMLFLRSPGGISHHPSETVLPRDVDLALEIGQRFIESMRKS